MINCNRINESVMSEMKRRGWGKKAVVESQEEKVADEKSASTEIPYKKGHYQFTFKTSKGKDGKWIRRIYKGDDMNALHDKAKAEALKDYPESYGHVMHSPQTDESVKEGEDEKSYRVGGYSKLFTLADAKAKAEEIHKKTGKIVSIEKAAVKEGEDEKEGLEDKQFDAPTGKEIDDLNAKPEGTDIGHDEEAEEQDDPTREKLETPEDEKDEMKGGAAELAADLRVSVRIERMNMGRYKKMLDKHDLSEDGQGWLKEKIEGIQATIDDMLERIPKLEKEAEEQEGGAEEAQTEIKEHMRSKLRKAIVEIAG
jgi:hypothetical protein